MSIEIISAGNAGFHVETGSARIYIDAFYGAIPGVAVAPAFKAYEVGRADIILVTHAHWDHFQAGKVADVAKRTDAAVVGPAPVISDLWNLLPPENLFEMEPARSPRGGCASSLSIELSGARITAFRTFHSEHHNSYLVETPGFRFFHDGDNENTARIDAGALGRLDALLIGPWKGSGWVEFIEKLDPARYFLMHLTEEELDEHESGRFLPEICDRVPRGLTVLRPGGKFVFDGNSSAC